ncbi:MAG TPA: septation protein A [Rhizomicrobium sp.]|nr:septation protein A [Rhizomicrobium sp.]
MSAGRRLSPLARTGLDLGPVVIFVALLLTTNAFVATGAFMAAMAAALAIGFAVERRFSPMALITGAIVLVFGGLTLYLHNFIFIQIKPTIIYTIFAIILAGGLATGRNFIKYLFDHAFHLTEPGWRMLTWRWVFFFIAMAIANEIVWRNFSLQVWGAYKLFGAVPLTFLFALAQTPLILKHQIEEKPADTAP